MVTFEINKTMPESRVVWAFTIRAFREPHCEAVALQHCTPVVLHSQPIAGNVSAQERNSRIAVTVSACQAHSEPAAITYPVSTLRSRSFHSSLTPLSYNPPGLHSEKMSQPNSAAISAVPPVVSVPKPAPQGGLGGIVNRLAAFRQRMNLSSPGNWESLHRELKSELLVE